MWHGGSFLSLRSVPHTRVEPKSKQKNEIRKQDWSKNDPPEPNGFPRGTERVPAGDLAGFCWEPARFHTGTVLVPTPLFLKAPRRFPSWNRAGSMREPGRFHAGTRSAPRGNPFGSEGHLVGKNEGATMRRCFFVAEAPVQAHQRRRSSECVIKLLSELFNSELQANARKTYVQAPQQRSAR